MHSPGEINRLLKHIATQPGVVGSVIVGHDGVLIGNNLPEHLDAASIGIWSMAIYVNTINISKNLGHNYVHQVVQRTEHGSMIIAAFGGGILVTLSNAHETENLIPLLLSIVQSVASPN